MGRNRNRRTFQGLELLPQVLNKLYRNKKLNPEDEDRQKTMRDTKKLENMESMKSMERGTCHSLKKLLRNFLRGTGEGGSEGFV